MKSLVTFFISAYTATLGKNLASHTFCLCQEFVENLIRSGFVGVGLNCTTVMMLTKAIWLLDDGYCMGSTFYLFVACLWCRWHSSLSAFVGFQQLPENQRNFFTVSNCLQVCRQHCVCVHRLYILSRLFSFVLPASHLTITIFHIPPVLHHPANTHHTHILQLPDLNPYTPKTFGATEERCLKHTHILSVEIQFNTQMPSENTHPATHLLCHITLWARLMGSSYSVRSQTVRRI